MPRTVNDMRDLIHRQELQILHKQDKSITLAAYHTWDEY